MLVNSCVLLGGVIFLVACKEGPTTATATADSVAPSVTLTSPTTGSVSGGVTVTANAADNVGIVGVQFLLDGANLGTEDSSSPYSINWDTSGLTPGTPHTLAATARDASGNSRTSTIVNVTINTTTPPMTGAPLVLYTDIVSGPNNGGEANNGAYLSIFGKNFGGTGLGSTVRVYINDAEISSYRYLGASKGRTDIQQITVQIGAIGNPTLGVALPIKVVVNGVASNTNNTFMVNPGKIYFVDNVSGSDASGVADTISKPYRLVQTSDIYTGGVWEHIGPGDFIVMRGHGAANPWVDVGFEKYFIRFFKRPSAGTPPTGAAGTGPITLMGYPGEDVYLRGTLAGGMSGGCVSGINGQSYPGTNEWVVVTNLRIDCEGYDGPVSEQIRSNYWRVVNNDLAASTAPTSGSSIPRMAGITGNGIGSFWVGNHIHDIQGSSGECHGLYIDGDGTYEIAYNHVHDIRSGNGYQSYVNGTNGSDFTNNISIHHNLIHDVSKHGINLADGTRNNVNIWNNLVYNVQFAAIRFNTTNLLGAKIFNNTFYNTNQAGNTNYGALTNDWNLPVGSMDVENNIFYVASGTSYNSGSNSVQAGAGTFTHNLWYNGTGNPDIDTSPVLTNPQFRNLNLTMGGLDFQLQATSPAKGNGASGVTSLVLDDYNLTTPRGTPIDIGAFQY